MSERDKQYDALRTVCNRQKERITDLERQLAEAQEELKEARKYSMSEKEWQKLYGSTVPSPSPSQSQPPEQ